MIHIVKSKNWEWSPDPFPAFRAKADISGKIGKAFLATKDVIPVQRFEASDGYGKILYQGFDRLTAEEAAKAGAAAQRAEGIPPSANVKAVESYLETGTFRVIRTRAKNTPLVVPSDGNADNCCVLFIGCDGGVRGSVSVHPDTTGDVLACASASDACRSTIEVAVVLEPGQRLVFRIKGRGQDDVRIYQWDSKKIITDDIEHSVWVRMLEVQKEIKEDL